MVSTEQLGSERAEKIWTYDAPYDVAYRRETIRKYGKSSLRVAQMDDYISYINEDMPEDCLITTGLEKYETHELTPLKTGGTDIYRPNRRGNYRKYANIIIPVDQFVGDRIVLDGRDAVVVNTAAGVGVSPKGSVKMISVRNPDIYRDPEVYEDTPFGELVETLLSVEKGTRRVVRYSWDKK